MLNSAQLTTLSNAINADPTLTNLNGQNGWQQIADAMNADSSPAVNLWKKDSAAVDLLGALLASDISGVTANYIAYLQILCGVPTVDATNANVRSNFTTIFTGKQTLTNLIAASSRVATRFEALADFTTAATPPAGYVTSSVYGYRVTAKDVAVATGKDKY